MEISILTIIGSLIFTLVWGFALMGLIDALGPLKRQLYPPRQSPGKHFYHSPPLTRA